MIEALMSASPARTTAGGRQELKYILPDSVARQVLRVAALFLRPEIYADTKEQLVTSLYLDTWRRAFLRAHQERQPDRFKLRVRRYGEASDGAVFVEVKRKRQAVVQKTRARVPVDAVSALVSGTRMPDLGLHGADAASLRQFFRYRLVHAADPVVLVQCIREALRGVDVERETAVTVDRHLRHQPVFGSTLVGDECRWLPVPVPPRGSEPAVVMELKYGTRPPLWMRPLITQLKPWRVSFSKYVAAMRGQGAPWM
jgi:hypothetical protein